MSTDTAYRRLIDDLADRIVSENGHRAMARCPAHDDNHPSLSLTDIGGRVLVYCHAGCQTADIVAALDRTMADLFDTRKGAEYRYTRRVVHRTPDKDFWQSGDTKDRSLFHIEKLPAGAATVYACEGENDVLAIESDDCIAVCNAMGAGKAHLADWTPLTGKDVIIVAHRDEAGKKHAAQVEELVHSIARSVKVVEAQVGNDAADHIAAGKTLDEFAAASWWQPQPADSSDGIIDGATLFDDIHTYLGRFLAYPTERAQIAHTLWIGHAWLMDCWESTPRIAFLSPEPGSGKTRALEITEPLVPNPIHSVNVTSAYLFRKIAENPRPTLLYDEIDTVFGPKAKENEEIRGVINSGHRNGATAGRCVIRGKVIETEELASYCAVMMAGLDDLPDTIMDRAVVIRMRKRAPGESVKPWRRRVNLPEAQKLHDRLSRWASQNHDKAAEHWPEMPEQITDRRADVWEPLLAVADLAADHWPATSRCSGVADVADSKQEGRSIGVLLLRDIRTVFAKRYEQPLVAADLITDLKGMIESPWQTYGRDRKGLDPRRLAQRLAKYGIASRNVRFDNGVFKAYEMWQFEDAWLRYLTTADDADDNDDARRSSEESATSATPQVSGDSVSATPTLGGKRHDLCWMCCGPKPIEDPLCPSCQADQDAED
jgi:hypothetical protein